MTRTLRNSLRAGLAVLLIASALFAAASPVQASSVIMVTTFTDEDGANPGQCALREAIVAANTNQGFGGCAAGSDGTDIIFLSAGTYLLSIGGTRENASHTGDLDVTSSISLTGVGAGSTTIHGNGLDRVFEVRSTNNVSIANLTITGGSAPDGAGVLVNNSSADFFNVYVANNIAFSAVGETFGGGFAITRDSNVFIYNSEITSNRADRAGAIISDGLLTLNNSLIYANQSVGGTALGAVEINSLSSGLNRIENTSIAGNTAPSADLVAGVRVSSTADVLIRNATIVDNNGTGLAVQQGGDVDLSHSIIARQQGSAADCVIQSSAFTTLGHNLAGDGSCLLNAGGDQQNVADGALGLASAPADNGGKTRTFALEPSSPAVDKGSPVLDAANPAACQPVDQRYYFRPGDGNLDGQVICDIGAFELEGTRPNSYTFLPAILR